MYDFNKSLRFSFANDFDAIHFFTHFFSYFRGVPLLEMLTLKTLVFSSVDDLHMVDFFIVLSFYSLLFIYFKDVLT